MRQSEFDASCTPSAKGPGHAMLRRPYTVQVKELRYPGRPQDVEDPTGKWVYAFREGKLQAEATCVEGGTWDNWAVHGALRRPSGNARGVQVDPGPKGQRYKYSYLLSPVRLPQSVLDAIDTARLASAAVECACDRFEKAIYVPDPLRWACEVNERFYLPRLNTLSGWIYDANMAASDFIARVLKAWIDAGDAAGIKNQLHRQPDSWLDARRTGMARATEAAEEAAAYLAHCVTSVEYLAVEQACLAQGEEEVELAAVCLATATRGILQTAPGRELAARLLGDQRRLPRKVIFNDDRPVLEGEAFARLRFGQRALLGLLAELYPAWNDLRASETKASLPKDQASLDELKKLGAQVRLAAEADAALAATELSPKLRASLARKREVQQFLEHCGVRTKRTKETLTGKQLAALRRRRTILANLEKNRPITKGLREGSPAAKRMLKEWDTVLGELEKLEVVEVEVEAKVKATAPSGPEVRLAKGKETLAELDRARKAYAPYEAFAQKLTLTAGTAVEIINVANAMRDLAEAMETGAPTGKKSLSVLGALADLVEHGAGMTESFFGSGMSDAAKGWVKKVGGVAGVVGGVIDMLDYEEQTLDAYAEYDFGKAVGRSLQTAGAAASAAGSAMVLVAAIAEAAEIGTSLGALGVIIALAGGVLVATGHFVAKWLELNANQLFAIRSFLGWHRQGVGADVSWSKVDLPNKNPRQEALALSDLLAQFQVSRGGYSDKESRDWEVELIPGFYEEGSRFEVDIETSWDNKAAQALLGAARTAGEPGCGDVARLPEPVHFRLLVDLSAGEVRQLEGPALKPGEVRRDAEGEVESVNLNLEEVVEPEKPALEEGPLKVDEVAGLLAGPPSRSFLRTHAYRVTKLKVRLVRPAKGDPPIRYVPSEEGRAMQVILPSMAMVTSLDAPAGEPMAVWAAPPPEPRSPEEDN